MSDLRRHGTGAWAPLDPASRQVALRFAFRLAFLVLIACAPIAGGAEPVGNAARFLALACAVCGCITMALGTARREPLGRGSLNRWDEALAFIAISRLIGVALHLAS